MKIAAKHTLTALAAVIGVGIGSVSGAFSQSVGPEAPVPAVAPAPAPAPEPTAGSGASAYPSGATTYSPVVSSSAAAGSIHLPSASAAETKKVGGDDKSDIPMTSPKVPDSVKGVVSRLNDATKDVTLEDLNSAREAVVKLDVLIDIEKRLNDLSSLRREREEKAGAPLAGAIPASALGLPGARGNMPIPALLPSGMPSSIPFPGVTGPSISAPSMPSVPGPSAVSVPTGPSTVEVSRITGASGRYVASIKEADGRIVQVREGEKLADGSKVISISRDGLTLSKDKKKKTIQVKDVPTVFGAR